MSSRRDTNTLEGGGICKCRDISGHLWRWRGSQKSIKLKLLYWKTGQISKVLVDFVRNITAAIEVYPEFSICFPNSRGILKRRAILKGVPWVVADRTGIRLPLVRVSFELIYSTSQLVQSMIFRSIKGNFS